MEGGSEKREKSEASWSYIKSYGDDDLIEDVDLSMATNSNLIDMAVKNEDEGLYSASADQQEQDVKLSEEDPEQPHNMSYNAEEWIADVDNYIQDEDCAAPVYDSAKNTDDHEGKPACESAENHPSDDEEEDDEQQHEDSGEEWEDKRSLHHGNIGDNQEAAEHEQDVSDHGVDEAEPKQEADITEADDDKDPQSEDQQTPAIQVKSCQTNALETVLDFHNVFHNPRNVFQMIFKKFVVCDRPRREAKSFQKTFYKWRNERDDSDFIGLKEFLDRCAKELGLPLIKTYQDQARLYMAPFEGNYVEIENIPECVTKDDLLGILTQYGNVLDLFLTGEDEHVMSSVVVSMETKDGQQQVINALNGASLPGLQTSTLAVTEYNAKLAVYNFSLSPSYINNRKKYMAVVGDTMEFFSMKKQLNFFDYRKDLAREEKSLKTIIEKVIYDPWASITEAGLQHPEIACDEELVAKVKKLNRANRMMWSISSNLFGYYLDFSKHFVQVILNRFEDNADVTEDTLLKLIFKNFPEVNVLPHVRERLGLPDLDFKWILVKDLPAGITESQFRQQTQAHGEFERVMIVAQDTPQPLAVCRASCMNDCAKITIALRKRPLEGKETPSPVLRYTGKFSDKKHPYNREGSRMVVPKWRLHSREKIKMKKLEKKRLQMMELEAGLAEDGQDGGIRKPYNTEIVISNLPKNSDVRSASLHIRKYGNYTGFYTDPHDTTYYHFRMTSEAKAELVINKLNGVTIPGGEKPLFVEFAKTPMVGRRKRNRRRGPLFDDEPRMMEEYDYQTMESGDRILTNPKQPKEIVCKTCNVKCSSMETYYDHVNGAKHRQVNKLPAPSHPEDRYCEMCNVKTTGISAWSNHIGGVKHRRKLAQKEREESGSHQSWGGDTNKAGGRNRGWGRDRSGDKGWRSRGGREGWGNDWGKRQHGPDISGPYNKRQNQSWGIGPSGMVYDEGFGPQGSHGNWRGSFDQHRQNKFGGPRNRMGGDDIANKLTNAISTICEAAETLQKPGVPKPQFKVLSKQFQELQEQQQQLQQMMQQQLEGDQGGMN